MSAQLAARPLQAAVASATTFAAGAAVPILVITLVPPGGVIALVSGASLVCLAALGGLAARTGGASAWIGARRVAFWGALAMAVTAGVGALFGASVS
jgi:VIT1/CCC1 family predicted Fe2+/Mn2+ transporter